MTNKAPIPKGQLGQFARAYTVIELCLALIVTAMVMGAVAAFSLASGTAWKTAEKSQAITILGNQVAMRLQNEVRKAKLIGACQAGSSDGSASGAAVLLWVGDTNGDGYIQGNEVEMIEHDPSTQTLRLWYVGQADANGTWSYGTTFTSAATIAQFKQHRQWTKLAGGVCGAVFQTSGTTGTSLNPSLSFGLKLMVDDSQSAITNSNAVGGGAKTMVEYGTATLRTPLAQPNN